MAVDQSRVASLSEIYAPVKSLQKAYQKTGNFSSYEGKWAYINSRTSRLSYDTSLVKPRRIQYDGLRRC